MSDPWITTDEHQRLMAEKDAEIERLRGEREYLARELNEAETALVDSNALRQAAAVRADIERIARADERKRTADAIAHAADLTAEDQLARMGKRDRWPRSDFTQGVYAEARRMARIAREVGGSDDLPVH